MLRGCSLKLKFKSFRLLSLSLLLETNKLEEKEGLSEGAEADNEGPAQEKFLLPLFRQEEEFA